MDVPWHRVVYRSKRVKSKFRRYRVFHASPSEATYRAEYDNNNNNASKEYTKYEQVISSVELSLIATLSRDRVRYVYKSAANSSVFSMA